MLLTLNFLKLAKSYKYLELIKFILKFLSLAKEDFYF